MKVLIIEDNDYKLEDAIRILRENGINDYVHVNNYIEAIDICFRKKRLSEFDFIILDIQFYEYRYFPGSHQLPDQHAGYKFLYQLASRKCSIPVFVFSSVTDYKSEYTNFLLPTFSEYSKNYKQGSPSFVYVRSSTIAEKYEAEKTKNKQILEDTSFVVGQAHNQYELTHLIKTYMDSNNRN